MVTKRVAETAAEIAEREARWRAALAQAEAWLAAGEPQDAERQAKALSAIAKAAMDLAQWRTSMNEVGDETEEDGETFRRELELRINRYRREQGLDHLFDEDPVAP
jgi:hypothetical protein